jgi:hypothetical protein
MASSHLVKVTQGLPSEEQCMRQHQQHVTNQRRLLQISLSMIIHTMRRPIIETNVSLKQHMADVLCWNEYSQPMAEACQRHALSV